MAKFAPSVINFFSICLNQYSSDDVPSRAEDYFFGCRLTMTMIVIVLHSIISINLFVFLLSIILYVLLQCP